MALVKMKPPGGVNVGLGTDKNTYTVDAQGFAFVDSAAVAGFASAGWVSVTDLPAGSPDNVVHFTNSLTGVSELSAGGKPIHILQDTRGDSTTMYRASGSYGLTYQGGGNAPQSVVVSNGIAKITGPVGTSTEVTLPALPTATRIAPKTFMLEIDCENWLDVQSISYYAGATGWSAFFSKSFEYTSSGINNAAEMTGLAGIRKLFGCQHSLIGGGTAPDLATTQIDLHKIRVTSASGKAAVFSIRSVVWNVTDIPSISITFDDGYASIFNNAMPVMNARGLVGSWGIIADLVGSGPRYTTWENCKTWVSYGHECVVHGPRSDIPATGAGPAGALTRYATVEESVADMSWHRRRLIENGLGDGVSENVYVWPQGIFWATDRSDSTLREEAAKAGFIFARGTEGPRYYNSKIAGSGFQRMTIPTIGYSYNAGNEAQNITDLMSRIDQLWAHGKSACIYFHEVGVASPVDISLTNFTTLMDHIAKRVAQGLIINPRFSRQVHPVANI
ncbi:MAG: polysaccharide deacetylase family protein [Sulfuricella sp.]